MGSLKATPPDTPRKHVAIHNKTTKTTKNHPNVLLSLEGLCLKFFCQIFSQCYFQRNIQKSILTKNEFNPTQERWQIGVFLLLKWQSVPGDSPQDVLYITFFFKVYIYFICNKILFDKRPIAAVYGVVNAVIRPSLYHDFDFMSFLKESTLKWSFKHQFPMWTMMVLNGSKWPLNNLLFK